MLASLITGFYVALFAISLIMVKADQTFRFPQPEIMDGAKIRAQEIINLIYQRFELKTVSQLQLFMLSLNLASSSWDSLKMRFVEKILTEGSNFTMVFSGTGVTAGYDNYMHQSYPAIVERRLSPIFHSLGIKLIVRNIAQLHVDCRLSNYCLEAMGGPQSDFISWENSFDCGSFKDVHEFIARVAGWHKAVLFYAVSGAFSLDGCPASQVGLLTACWYI
jgi:hypothetical protein